jgi:hypothetical protein
MATGPRAPAIEAVTTGRLDALVDAVQTNCDIADARHAADLPLCIYLLQMREFYRWEHGLAFGAAIDHGALGAWLARREARWAALEAQEFVPLPWGGARFDPLDAAQLNAELAPLGLAYGSGWAGVERPAFFLAQLRFQQQRDDGLQLQVCGREHARGLAAPPAALLGGQTIVLRREALARWLWEKFETFSLRRADGPFKAFAEAYGLRDPGAFVAALPRMVAEQSETLLLHELGEHRAGAWLEPGWAAMRLALGTRRTELQVRAVRDQLADLEVTLPALIQRQAEAGLHFWFANYDGVRERLYPSLVKGYAAWRAGDGGRALLDASKAGARHFRRLAQQVLLLHARHPADATPAIDRLLAAPDSVCG